MSKTLEVLRKEIGIAFDEANMSALRELVPALEAFDDPIAQADALRVRGKIAANDGDKTMASMLYDQAIELFRLHGDGTSEALTMNDIGSMHYHAEDYQRALECYAAVVDRFIASGRDQLALYALHNRAMCFKALGSLDQAYEAYQRCLELAQKHSEQSMVASAHIGLARIHLDRSEYGPGIEHYTHALDIAESINSSKITFSARDGLGMAYTDIGEYPTALQHLHIALQIADDTGHKRRSAQVSMSIANVYFDLNEHDTSLSWNERAVALYKELAEEYGEISTIENIANIHNARGDVDAAIPLYERVLEYCKSTHRDAHLASTLCNLTACYFNADRYEEGRFYLDAVDAIDVQVPITLLLRKQLRAGLCKHEGDLAMAASILLECLELSETFQLRPYAINLHEDLREIALLNNDLASYVLHNTRSTEIRNELNGVSTAQKIAAQETERKLAAERREREKERAVLYSTLPKHIADRIVRGEQVTGDHYDNAAVIFVDIVGFTQISDQLSASDVVIFLERLFSQFDEICKRHAVTKIKTIGDSYMAVAFTEQPNNRITEQPNTSEEPSTSDPSHRAANAALDIMRAVAEFPSPVSSPEGSPASSPEGSPASSPEGSPASSPKGSPKGSPEGSPVSVRLGLHCGAVTAGVIGTERLQYDVWGDTVNVASRLESTGEPGKIQVSAAFAQTLGAEVHGATFLGLRPRNDRPQTDDSQQREEGTPVIPNSSEELGTWHLALRGEIELKGKGKMTTYWLLP